MSRRARVAIVACLAALSAPLGNGASQAIEQQSRPTRIVFVRFMGHGQKTAEIFTILSDGTRPRRLTHNNYFDGCPIWFPDGQRIAFCSERGEDREILTMNSVGSDVHTVTAQRVIRLFTLILSRR